MAKTFNLEEYAEEKGFFLRDIRKRELTTEEKGKLWDIVHEFMLDLAPDSEVMDVWHPRVDMYVQKYFKDGEWHWWSKATVEMDKFFNVVRAY